MISALYSNPNFDSKEAKREEVIEKLEKEFDNLIYTLYNNIEASDAEEEFEINPAFFAASEKQLAKQGVPELEEFEDKGPSNRGFFDDIEIEVDQS